MLTDFSRKIPQNYFAPVRNGGQIDLIEYGSKRYYSDRSQVFKKALVYVPPFYDNSRASYKTLYLCHGGGGNECEYLMGQDKKEEFRHILDHMILNGDIEPVIVITPSFYYDETASALHDIKDASVLTRNFHNELRNDLLPYIESHYRVIPDRKSRVFGGFSMGAETTWETFINALDLIENFIPQSGDCWIKEIKGGLISPEETVSAMTDLIKKNGFENLSYNIFAVTGEKDIAYDAMKTMVEEMLRKGYGSNGNTLRTFYNPEGVHAYSWCYEYLYNCLPVFFK